MSEPGRRTAARSGRAVNPTVLLAVVFPLLTVGALLLVRPPDPADSSHPPDEVALTETTLVCPTGAAMAIAAADDRSSGEVQVGPPSEPVPVRVRADRVAEPAVGTGPAVARGSGAVASGLVAARFGDPAQVAATDCPTPAPLTWFTGVGAGARHSSVLELVNPDDGPAVADISVYGRSGLVDEPGLRGVTVTGHDSVRLDLAEEIPRRTELALQVVVSRGRLAASVYDELPELGATPATSDWLPGQTEPALDTLLLGLTPGPGEDRLVLTNPGDDEARVDLKVVTADAAFVPEGVEEVTVAPSGVETVSLTTVLREAVRDGALGVQVTATAPVTASLRSVVSGDLSHAVPVSASADPMTVLVPPGATSVVLARSEGVGVGVVTAWSASGRELATKRVELARDGGAVVEVPRGAALLRVDPERTAVSAAAVVTRPGAGATVVPFRELIRRGLVPDVRPGLP